VPQLISGTSLTQILAVMPNASGWVINRVSAENCISTTTARFISLTSWSSEVARTEWYGGFARRATNEFDRVGHVIYWIQTLCERIDTQFLVLEEQDSEIRARESEILLKQPFQPGSIFTIH